MTPVKVANPTIPGGELEYSILVALWQRKVATVREIYDDVSQDGRLGYTTIAKVLERLRDKCLVTREREGKLLVYRPAVARASLEKARAGSMLAKLWGQAPERPVAALVDAVEAIDPALLGSLADEIERRRNLRRGS